MRKLQPRGEDRSSRLTSTGRRRLVGMNVFGETPSVPLPGLAAVTFYVSGSIFIVLGQFCPHLPGPKPQTSRVWVAHRAPSVFIPPTTSSATCYPCLYCPAQWPCSHWPVMLGDLSDPKSLSFLWAVRLKRNHGNNLLLG